MSPTDLFLILASQCVIAYYFGKALSKQAESKPTRVINNVSIYGHDCQFLQEEIGGDDDPKDPPPADPSPPTPPKMAQELPKPVEAPDPTVAEEFDTVMAAGSKVAMLCPVEIMSPSMVCNLVNANYLKGMSNHSSADTEFLGFLKRRLGAMDTCAHVQGCSFLQLTGGPFHDLLTAGGDDNFLPLICFPVNRSFSQWCLYRFVSNTDGSGLRIFRYEGTFRSETVCKKLEEEAKEPKQAP